ncbi:MAG: LicD family protein [Lachnospiraceae bacterium]|nr:LicD family protein [Lachnospiraceae bacterium]
MIFKTEFFKEEIREGFTVAEMMKRAWAAELEVLEVIEKTCADLGINYYAYGGTLLGAVRHKGFIPWDDDLDICMKKEDYRLFIEKAPEYLPEGFVISGIFSDEPRLQDANKEPQARVIADETMFPLPKYMNRFHSFPYMRVGIDIFPLYYLPRDVDKQIELVTLINDMQVTAGFLDHFRKKGELSKRIDKYEKILGEKIFDSNDDVLAKNLRLASDTIASLVEAEDADYVFNTLYLRTPKEPKGFKGYKGYKLDWFGSGVKLEYENTQICAPLNYTDVLRVEFGDDYMTPKMFAAEHEYPFYKNQEEAFIKLLRESNVNTPVDDFCRNWHLMNGGN